jgi:hypothetical protein
VTSTSPVNGMSPTRLEADRDIVPTGEQKQAFDAALHQFKAQTSAGVQASQAVSSSGEGSAGNINEAALEAADDTWVSFLAQCQRFNTLPADQRAPLKEGISENLQSFQSQLSAIRDQILPGSE